MDFYFANCLTTVCVRTKQTIESIKMQELYIYPILISKGLWRHPPVCLIGIRLCLDK
jgi:hypothetical protein